MRVLFTGLGSIGQRHLRNLSALLGPELEPLAYRARRQSVLLNDANEPQPGLSPARHHGVREFDDYQAALAQQPDVVFVTNPTSMHLDTALQACRAGCHLFIEKPLSHTLQGVDELIDVAESTHRVCMVGCQNRFHPGLLQVKRWLDEDRIGKVLSARLENGEYLPRWHPYEDYRHGYAAREDLGGGALLSQIHDIDSVLWLLGMPETVFCVGGQLSSLNVDVDDTDDLLLACCGDHAGLAVSVHLDYVQWPPVKRGQLIGDRGRIVWDLTANVATLTELDTQQREAWQDTGYQRNEAFVTALEHFLMCLRGEAEVGVPLRAGRDALRIALAARHSAQTGAAVKV